MTLGGVPFLSTRVRDGEAWITLLYVPPAMRRKGWGRRMVDAWLAHVPNGVRQVRLLAAEIDGEDPAPFWEKLGFHDDVEPAWAGGVPMRFMRRAVDHTDGATAANSDDPH